MKEYVPINCKVIMLDEYVRIEQFGKPISGVYEPRLARVSTRRSKASPSQDKNAKRRRISKKEKDTLCDLIDLNFNVDHMYITLTHSNEKISIAESHRHFENWIKRMRERYGDFKYLGVPSFQEKRGTIHYHLLMTIPRIPKEKLNEFERIWGHGNVHVEKIYLLKKAKSSGKLKQYLIEHFA